MNTALWKVFKALGKRRRAAMGEKQPEYTYASGGVGREERVRKMSFNKLSDAETERLAILAEEMGEAQQAIGKIIRHARELSRTVHND